MTDKALVDWLRRLGEKVQKRWTELSQDDGLMLMKAADAIEASLAREERLRGALTLVSKTDKWEHDIGQKCKCQVCAALGDDP